MFSTDWQVSERQHEILIERDRKIQLDDGIKIDCDIFRPQGDEKFPVILAMHPYDKAWQSNSTMPVAFSGQGSSYETGDYNFYVRRGYVLVIANLRGTHASEGFFSHLDPDQQSVRDIYETIEWLSAQPWSDGNVGMVGVSYLAVVQKRVAALAPPHLKAIFAPYGWSDGYRDLYYRGGIAAHGFLTHWLRTYCVDYQLKNNLREAWGDEKYDAAIAKAQQDPELMAIPAFKEALENPDAGVNPYFCEILANNLIGDYFTERAMDFEAASTVPLYAGG
ncbi:MAG: CocE/NonD family hydrolase, partial [Rhodospirillales bacterium]|nr:CocE/NonD family hydrolase [Rhodospirillales bacterium]